MLKNSKKKMVAIGSLVLMFLLVSAFIFNSNDNNDIEKVMEKSSYSYLPKEAKNFIKQVYKESGEIVLTEKNKEEGNPYLNPQFAEYLTMSEKEQKEVALIPDTYIVDYIASDDYKDSDLPASYDLRNINNKSYITPLKSQGSLGICWAISAIENAETFLMLKNNSPYQSGSQIFSSRQLDYATSNNGMIDRVISSSTTYLWENEDNGCRELGEGGNFYLASTAMANGLTLTDESFLPWNTSKNTLYPYQILNYDQSKYEVDTTIQMGTINADTASDSLRESYNNELKEKIIAYGGAFVSTYSPQSTCGFTNTDGNPVLKTDDCVSNNTSSGHAMQIIGWDDDYSYSYCDAGVNHYASSNKSCTTGTYTEGTGAWIIRNSWGDSSKYKYVYLTYDSTRIAPSFVTSLSSMQNRKWDNNYHTSPWINGLLKNGLSPVTSQDQDFDVHSYETEKIEKIKFLNYSTDGEYTLSIDTGENEYSNIATAKVPNTGYYTFDLSDKNILIEDSIFTVTIESTNEKKFIKDSIAVFTSNVEDASYINTYSTDSYFEDEPLSKYNPLYLTGDNYWGTNISIYPKNFPANSTFTYRLKDSSDVYNTNFADITTSLYNDYSKIIFSGTRDSIGSYKQYTMEILYNGQVVDSFPVKFNTSSSGIKFYANKGTDYYIKKIYQDKTDANLENIVNGDLEFFNDGYYITEWNTEKDGSGISFDVDEVFEVFADLDLYAQWSTNRLNTIISYQCKSSDSCDGTLSKSKFSYDSNIEFKDNYFTKDGYTFLYWEGEKGNYYEGEEVAVKEFDKYQVYNNNVTKYYAKWSNNYKTISFDANSGTGSMKPINVEISTDSRIKYNSFTKEGYEFVGWNTKEDGTGTEYKDGSNINTDKDITLYAQWEDERHPIKEVKLSKTELTIERGKSEILIATIVPENTLFDKTITWKTSDSKIAIVANGKVTGIKVGTATVTATSSNGKTATCEVTVTRPPMTVLYTTHVQDIGWQGYVIDGAMSGTSHQSKRLEAIKIKLEDAPYDGNIEYRTHIQDIGWESSFKKNDAMSGTSHQSKRLEAIEIKLTGDLANYYDVYYRVHAQDVGWMAWAKNGEQAGTSGYSRRLEAIEIVVVEKGKNPPTRTDTRTNKAFVKKQITYATHVQDYGWQDGVSDGEMSGTSHQSKRLEGIVIVLNKPEVSGNVEYKTHIQNIGWEKDFKKNGEMSGTSHQSKRLEAIQIKLTGEMAEKYDIYYRVHAQEFGWMGWAKNGESAGTAHYSYRLEAIEIVLVEKGENPPERTDTKTNKTFVDKDA